MRALPERQYFELKGAAKYLECSAKDVQYYLKEGALRYAVPLRSYDGFTLVSIACLPDAIQKTLSGLKKPDLMLCMDVSLLVDDSVKALPLPEYLYFKDADRTLFYVTEDAGAQVRAHLLELFDGTRVSLWLPISGVQGARVLTGAYIGRTDHDGFPAESVLTRDELDRLITPVTPSFAGPAVVSQATDSPFKLPQKTNDLANAMCEYGNIYFHRHGKVPSVVELLNSMRKDGEKLGMVAGRERDEYSFNGRKLNLRQFRERYKKYLKE